MGKHPGSQNDFKKILQEVRQLSAFLWQKGWAEKNAGNLSVNVTGLMPGKASESKARFIKRPVSESVLKGGCFLVTATGARFRDVANDPERWTAVVKISSDLKGFHVLWGGKAEGWAPTSELPSHLKIHSLLKRSGGRDKAVLHTHPTELMALTHLGDLPRGRLFTELLWSMIPEVKMYVPGGACLAPYRMPGTEGLAEATLESLRTGAECVVWEMHGTLAVGPSPMDAFDVTDVLNKAAQVYMLARASGGQILGLEVDQMVEIEKNFPPPPKRK
jgi:rhamnulose-1-phosphate aldolase